MSTLERKRWVYEFSAALIRSTEIGEQPDISEADQPKVKKEMHKLAHALELIAKGLQQ